MKCPKCAYLSFEPEPRCKHCGYDFSLSDLDLDVEIHAESESMDNPLADFRLHDDDPPLSPVTLGPMRPAAAPRPFAAVSGAVAMTLDPLELSPDFPAETLRPQPVTKPQPVPPLSPPVAQAARSAHVTTELPLFVKGLAEAEARSGETTAREAGEPSRSVEPIARIGAVPDILPDEPPIKVPAAPRPPLAVRRQTDVARPAAQERAEARPERKLGPFDRDLLEDLQRIEAKAAGRPLPHRESGREAGEAMRRLGAAAIDLAFLAGILASVVSFTLRQCDLPVSRLGEIPLAPLVAFLALIVVGYLFLFTAASGQTIGKMIVGLRVVGAPDEPRAGTPSLRQATYRALLTVPSVLVLGAGFLPALVGPGLALHDRLAHTRVVRA